MAVISDNVDLAKEYLERDLTIGLPTETVYGLAGNALNEQVIASIFQIKRRPKFDPLIAHIGSKDQLPELVQSVPPAAKQLIDRFWPGPLTILLPKRAHIPDLLTSGLSRVAVRMPQHPVALSLLQSISYPLAAPSANPFGYVSPTSASHVNDQLGGSIPYILDGGDCNIGIESTIVGFENDAPIIYRLGGLSVEDIKDEIGPVSVKTNNSSNPSAPGMLKSHYSPGKELIIGDIEMLKKQFPEKGTAILSFQKQYATRNNYVLSGSGDQKEAAANLFSILRKLDQAEVQRVLVELVPEDGLGKAINDRLRRAAVR